MKRHSFTLCDRRPALALVLALACGMMATACTSPAVAQDGLPAIYIMDAGGDNFRLLVKLEGKWNGSPKFSPDGKQVLFDASPNGDFEQGHVYVIAADAPPGTEPADLGLGSTPAWSPDGKRITFYVHRDNPDGADAGVWVMNADGSEREWLNYGNGPRYSPDGKKILLVNDAEGNGEQVFIYDLDKSESTAASDRTYAKISGATWSPNGKRIALIGRSAGGAELVIVPVDGGDRSGTVRLAGQIGWRPTWSPDGKYIGYWVANELRQSKLHRLEVDSDREGEMLAHQDEGRINSDMDWSPDGKRIVFMSDR